MRAYFGGRDLFPFDFCEDLFDGFFENQRAETEVEVSLYLPWLSPSGGELHSVWVTGSQGIISFSSAISGSRGTDNFKSISTST